MTTNAYIIRFSIAPRFIEATQSTIPCYICTLNFAIDIILTGLGRKPPATLATLIPEGIHDGLLRGITDAGSVLAD